MPCYRLCNSNAYLGRALWPWWCRALVQPHGFRGGKDIQQILKLTEKKTMGKTWNKQQKTSTNQHLHLQVRHVLSLFLRPHPHQSTSIPPGYNAVTERPFGMIQLKMPHISEILLAGIIVAGGSPKQQLTTSNDRCGDRSVRSVSEQMVRA